MNDSLLSPAKVKDDLDHIRLELQEALSRQIAQHSVSVHMEREGLVISLREAGFFSSGSATPRPETLPTLRQVAASVGHTPYDMRIEGHTDNLPIHNAEFDSNWELSSARATRIARLFLDIKAIPAGAAFGRGLRRIPPRGQQRHRRGPRAKPPRGPGRHAPHKINLAAPGALPPAARGARSPTTTERS